MKTTTRLLMTLLLLGGFSSAFAKNDNGNNGNQQNQAGGLPALAAEVAELRAMVEALQGDNEGDPYEGRFAVNLVEWNAFGCGLTTDPAIAIGAGTFLQYLQNQGISSTTTRTANFEVDSDGMEMFVPEHSLLSQELRLSGQYEEDTRVEGGISVIVAADGSLSIPAATAVVSGQMSADGSAFSILIRETFEEDSCADAYTILVSGIRK